MSLFLVASLIGCHPHPITKSVYDRDLNCEQLKSEMNHLNNIHNKIQNNTGVCARNVLLGMLFWPTIIMNEAIASTSKKAVQDRYEYLMTLYENSSCSTSECENTVDQI